MDGHRFRVGQVVHYRQHELVGAPAKGDFRVERLLPPDGNDPQYRIRSPGEGVERVAREGELSDAWATQRLAQELYEARDGSGVPWGRRLAVVREAWLQVARDSMARGPGGGP